MQVHNLSTENSILNSFIAQIRSAEIQKDSMRFRRNIERIGEILGYEMSKSLLYETRSIETPLANAEIDVLSNEIVLCSILRAGIPLHNGLLNYFDTAQNAFISAYRQHSNDSEAFKIIVEYLACPDLENKTLIIADPMLATGQSLIAALKALKPFGTPKEIHFITVISAKKGIAYVDKNVSRNTHLWTAAIDDKLSNKGYIIPGLGDAGDLAYGKKLQG